MINMKKQKKHGLLSRRFESALKPDMPRVALFLLLLILYFLSSHVTQTCSQAEVFAPSTIPATRPQYCLPFESVAPIVLLFLTLPSSVLLIPAPFNFVLNAIYWYLLAVGFIRFYQVTEIERRE